MKKVFTVILMLASFSGWSQSFLDNALLFSQTSPGGSARIQAIGGAQVSLGGDYSSALSNPAGLGMYNRTEITFSPGYTLNNVAATYLGTKTDNSTSKFYVPGVSVVFHKPSEYESDFIGGSFAFSATRINDLNLSYSYSGDNDISSIIDYFTYDSYGIAPEEMLFGGSYFNSLSGLAYNNYLTEDFVNDDGEYEYFSLLSPLDNEIRTIKQTETINRKGSQYQYSFSYGANFSDKIFLGGGIGVTTLRYQLTQVYRESNFSFSEDPSYQPLDNFEVQEDLEIKGAGINLTLGLIVRPIDHLQVGLSYISRTNYLLTDTYSASLKSEWNNFDYYDDGTVILNDVSEQFEEPLISEYNFSTPSKFSMGGTYITKMGFISTDIEFVNYSKGKYSSNTQDITYNPDNDDIRDVYKTAVNFRIGGEVRMDMYRFRVGYNLMGDPYKDNDGLKRNINSYSGGAGIKTKHFFADLAFVLRKQNGARVPYSTPDFPTPVASLNYTNTSFILTVGTTF